MSTPDAGSGTSSDAGPGTSPGTGSPGRPSRRAVAVTLAAVVGALLVVGVAVGARDRGVDTAGPGTATPTATPSPRPSGTPSSPATPSGSPAPTATADPPAAGPTEPPPAEEGLPPGLSVVEPGVVPELAPVPLDEPADFGTEVTARLVRVERVDGEGRGLGEESGPALAVTVEMTNGTPEAVDLSFVVVNLEDGDGNPGQSLFGDPRSAPFGGPLAPGASRTATYVLRLPSPDPAAVTVTVSYGAEAPTAVFAGPVPPPGTPG